MSYHGEADGHFSLYYRRGWAHLVVYPPRDGGTPVYFEDVQNRMKLLGVPRISSTVLRGIVREADGKEHRVVEWPEGARLASGITVEIDEDRMTAYIQVDPPKKGAAPPEVQDLVNELETTGVVYGVDRGVLADLLRRRRYGERISVAFGTAPVDARSASIEYLFDTNRGKPYLEMDFGRINLKELNFIEDKDEGDLLARLQPPVPPEDGATVTGSTLSALRDTTPVALSAGQNTALSEDGTELYAAADGNVRLKNGVVIIEPVVTVENVNYETGNIEFEGSVVVENSIADGFVIRADGDVQVGRGVGRSCIEAGGNVLLKTGVNGNGDARVSCRGNLFAKYIESATIKCEGHVFVEEAIMHSHVFAWKHCVLNGRRAEVLASNLIVGGTLWCKKLGGIYEARTHVAIGIAPDVLTEYRDCKSGGEQAMERLGKVELQLELLSKAVSEGRNDERTLLAQEQLGAEAEELRTKATELRRREKELRGRLQASRSSYLVVEDTMYKGASVTFGTAEFRAPDKGVRKTILRPGPSGVEESGYNPASKPELNFE